MHLNNIINLLSYTSLQVSGKSVDLYILNKPTNLYIIVICIKFFSHMQEKNNPVLKKVYLQLAEQEDQMLAVVVLLLL